MATRVSLEFPRASNGAIASFFAAVAPYVEIDEFTASVAGKSDVQSFEIPLSKPINPLLGDSNFSIFDASISRPGFSIRYLREIENKDTEFFVDQVEFFNNSVEISDDILAEIHRLAQEHFGESPGAVAGIFRNPKLFRDLMASHHRQLVELQRTVNSVGKEAVTARAALEKEYYDRKKQLDVEADGRRAQVEEELGARRADLVSQEAELAERRRQLDDRGNTHARRQLRSDLKERLKQYNVDAKISAETRSLRSPIHYAVGVGITGIAALIAYYAFLSEAVVRDRSMLEAAAFLVKPLGLTIAVLGLGTWYLRWLNRWFERHSELEFQLKQFELDIDRASWVVETALEWRQVQNSTIPDHLLESISRNLFSRSDKDETADMHPADYLASALLGKASGLRLALPGGGELEYGAKALKEAGKAG